MGELELYRELKNAPDEDTRMQVIAHAIEVAKHGPDLSELATKRDLAELRADIFKAMNELLMKFLGGIALLGVVFKLAEMFLK